MNDKQYLQLAIKQAKKSVKKGGFPAGAIVVRNGKVISKGVSLGFLLNDPISHAETVSIREACKKLETVNLTGAILYASLQPCMMCFSVATWAGISKIVYGCKKTEGMVSKDYCEGSQNIKELNKMNNRLIDLVFIPDFEKESLNLVKKWEVRNNQ